MAWIFLIVVCASPFAILLGVVFLSAERITRNVKKWIVIGMSLLFGATLVWGAWVTIIKPFHQQVRYSSERSCIASNILSLRSRRPPDIDPEAWEQCVRLARTAVENIFFSPSETDYSSMCRFGNALDNKLKDPVDMGVFEWIVARLEETGPTGKHYRTLINDRLIYFSSNTNAVSRPNLKLRND